MGKWKNNILLILGKLFLENMESDFDRQYIMEALEEAKKAFALEEVPVGAVAVQEGRIIARAFNQVESLKDASAHAEILCMRKASEFLGRWRLFDVTLYTTLEPCCMCAGALFSFRIQRLVWGALDIRQGADGSFVSLFSQKHPIHEFSITRGVLAENSSELMKTFFQKRRR
jgi:tRNA(adenine34) deaminase